MPHNALAEVLVRFVRDDGAALVLSVDPGTLRVDVRSGSLADIDAAARESILAGIGTAVRLERARGSEA